MCDAKETEASSTAFVLLPRLARATSTQRKAAAAFAECQSKPSGTQVLGSTWAFVLCCFAAALWAKSSPCTGSRKTESVIDYWVNAER